MNNRPFPLQIKIGFKKLFDSYRAIERTSNSMTSKRIAEILKIEKENPKLSSGISSEEALSKYKNQINFILEDLFAEVLTKNEIKFATVPYQEEILCASERFMSIIELAGEEMDMELADLSEEQYYVMGCSIILANHYNFQVDFRRPFYYKIPDKQGILRSYRVLYNGDFVNIEKTKNAKEITKEDISELLDNFDKIDLWKEKFPPNSWVFNGFVIANMYDATLDVSISNFKEQLLEIDPSNDKFILQFRDIMRSIFNIPEIEVGYSMYDPENKTFNKLPKSLRANSFILNKEQSKKEKYSLCDFSHQQLFEKKEFFTVSNVQKQFAKYPENVLLQSLATQNIGSIIIAPLVSDDKFLGVMEIASKNPEKLNSINAIKLKDLMPYLVDSLRRAKEKKENKIELLIQEECTSIHPSVHWRFVQEAKRVISLQDEGNMATFQEIVFNDVYPLYGQMDIKGSSQARNEATKMDLALQLRMVLKIVKVIYEVEELPIYEQIIFKIKEYLEELEESFEVESENRILSFFQEDITSLFKFIEKKDKELQSQIQGYYNRIDDSKGFVYKYRKQYDESVMQVNKTLASILDYKQRKAQGMYPHYYERFKTDGVEHNMYIGESITKESTFNNVYLYNLRLWQLQVICEMENSFYKLKGNLPVAMDIASMILVFNNPLSLRFRMDEKRFDVDGTYNARYEVVKKRVDKAKINGTDERITQPGKIAIIYAQEEDEEEYLKYVHFLQSKNYLGSEVETLELEDLQGVSGLKAIRVNVLYHHGEEDKKLYTYQDLMNEIES